MNRDLSDALKDLIVKGYNWTKYVSLNKQQSNRVQAQGVHLEDIVKDILCGVNANDASGRQALLDKHLVFQGVKNNPPDAMYRGGNSGDAFEVKKSKAKTKKPSNLDLNSSPPYSHLTSDLSRIARAAKNCENWDRRDIFYVVGNIEKTKRLNNWIWIVQGNIIAADLQTYRDFECSIKKSIDAAIKKLGLKSAVSNELGRINEVDLRKNTDLRVRPMWLMTSPMKLFKDIPGIQESNSDGLVIHCLIRKTKWNSYLKNKSKETKNFWKKPNPKMAISNVKVPDPNDLTKEIDVTLIRITLNIP